MRLFELNKLQPFKTDEYNTPNQMEIMANPDYWREKKGVVGGVQWMTPTEYIRACEIGFRRSGSQGLVRQGRNAELIKQYADDMKRGDKFPMLELDYRNDYFGQEGLHRAMAAEAIGVNKVPVFIMKDSPEKMSEAAIKLSSAGKKDPAVDEFMEKYYKVTQNHPFDPASRIAWDGKSTVTIQPFNDYINLSAIQTLAPGERSGSANGVIMTLVALADETGVPLRLSAKPFGNSEGKLTKRQLIAWYKRRGFVPDPTSGADGMTYTPQKSLNEGISGEQKTDLIRLLAISVSRAIPGKQFPGISMAKRIMGNLNRDIFYLRNAAGAKQKYASQKVADILRPSVFGAAKAMAHDHPELIDFNVDQFAQRVLDNISSNVENLQKVLK